MKNFQFWHLLKTKISNEFTSNKEFKVGEIWWCHIGLNVGSEEDGKNENYERPVFIIKKFNHTMFLGIPYIKEKSLE